MNEVMFVEVVLSRSGTEELLSVVDDGMAGVISWISEFLRMVPRDAFPIILKLDCRACIMYLEEMMKFLRLFGGKLYEVDVLLDVGSLISWKRVRRFRELRGVLKDFRSREFEKRVVVEELLCSLRNFPTEIPMDLFGYSRIELPSYCLREFVRAFSLYFIGSCRVDLDGRRVAFLRVDCDVDVDFEDVVRFLRSLPSRFPCLFRLVF